MTKAALLTWFSVLVLGRDNSSTEHTGPGVTAGSLGTLLSAHWYGSSDGVAGISRRDRRALPIATLALTMGVGTQAEIYPG